MVGLCTVPAGPTWPCAPPCRVWRADDTLLCLCCYAGARVQAGNLLGARRQLAPPANPGCWPRSRCGLGLLICTRVAANVLRMDHHDAAHAAPGSARMLAPGLLASCCTALLALPCVPHTLCCARRAPRPHCWIARKRPWAVPGPRSSSVHTTPAVKNPCGCTAGTIRARVCPTTLYYCQSTGQGPP